MYLERVREIEKYSDITKVRMTEEERMLYMERKIENDTVREKEKETNP